MCQILGKSHLSDQQIESIIQWCSFDHMKENEATNYEWLKEIGALKQETNFYRRGKIGDWKNYFSEELSLRFDEEIKKNLKTDHDFNYGS